MDNTDLIRNKAKYTRGWVGGRPETECGYGSRVNQTVVQRRFLADWVKQYKIKTVNDIGAGDLNWLPLIDWDVDYQGYDLVPRHPTVKPLDITQRKAPAADMLLCIWVLNHFPEAEAKLAWNNLMDSGSRYLAITWDSRLWDFMNLIPIESVQIRAANPGKHEGVFLRLLEC